MKNLQRMRHDAIERRGATERKEGAARGFGRRSTNEPLVDRDACDKDQDTRTGRCQKKAGRGCVTLAMLAFAISAPGCYASGPIENYKAPDNDQGSDTESESDSEQFQDAGLDTCTGEIDADKEEFLPEGQNARLTKAGHKIWAAALDTENGAVKVKITDKLWNQIGEEIELSEDTPSVELELDGETFSITFCGIVDTEEGPAAQFRTTRPKGFVHCDVVDCGNESNPLEHEVDVATIETIITHTESIGEYPDNDDESDCVEVVRTIWKQELSFAAPLSTQNNLGPEETKTVLVHDLDGENLEAFEMELLEVDGEEGSVKVGAALASGSMSADETMAGGDLEVTMEEPGEDVLPGFSYAWPPDPDALIWETSDSNPNEKEVDVEADSGYHPFVIRYTALQGDGSAYVKLFGKADVQILKDGEQARIGGQVYTSEIEMGAGIIANVTLEAVE